MGTVLAAFTLTDIPSPASGVRQRPGGRTPALSMLRARAAVHEADLDQDLVYWKPQELADRWQCSPSTVKAIPRDELPFREIGRGRKLRRRRYHPADVERYEARDRGTED